MSAVPSFYAEAKQRSEQSGALLLEAERLARSVVFGEHGRRRSGSGEHFWQYRPFDEQSDEPRMIDHRRSAKQDQFFVRQLEWQTPQALHLWVDNSASMQYQSKGYHSKRWRGAVLALAAAISAEKAGEKVGFADGQLRPALGFGQIEKMAQLLSHEGSDDYALLAPTEFMPNASALFVSDFLGDISIVSKALELASEVRVRGVVLQILDPSEVKFQFSGRAIFESMLGSVEHETLQASDLRSAYLKRLSARQDEIEHLCKAAGWHFLCSDGQDNVSVTLQRLCVSLGGEQL